MASKGQRWIQDLPKIGVPDLEKTMERYLATLKPVLPLAQFCHTKKTVEAFLEPSGDGRRLQKLLEELAQKKDNWVTDIWLDDMYLSNPLALPVNSSPSFLFPRQQFRSNLDLFRFAFRLVQFSVLFKKRIDDETLEQDCLRNRGGKERPLCMETYKHFFRACRIPGEDKDHLYLNDSNSDHIVVACRNQFFLLRIKINESLQDEEEIVDQFRLIWHLSKEYESKAPLVGLLTTENRRLWALHRNHLIKNSINRDSLSAIETSLFVLCLDDSVSVKVANAKHVRRDSTVEMAKMEPSYMASQVLHGCGSDYYSGNRWFDKFLQFVVGKDGVCGLCVEHSASEGITVVRFMEEFLAYYKSNPIENSSSSSNTTFGRKDSLKSGSFSKGTNVMSNKGIIRLHWELDDYLLQSIEDATKRINKLTEDLDLYILNFTEFGRNYIKEQNLSPDAFIQLALQLTYYKVHRGFVSTYESASLRPFKFGRVDNIRANTVEALLWARALCDEIPEITDNYKIDLFERAIRKQVEIMNYTLAGEGVDNHLLGLREMSKKSSNNNEIPQLFREKAYKEFLNFRLSTSQVPIKDGGFCCYGAVVPDGYGCCYNPSNDDILFSISSFYSSPETSSDFFALSLEGSLLQMRELCIKMKLMDSPPKK